MSGNIFIKDPAAELDYRWDWSTWLGEDAISGTPVITAQSGITVKSQSNTTTAVTVWLTGGTVGNHYEVTCRIVTAGGRTDERSIVIWCENR